MERAYSLINFKSVDEESRTIEGVATTPTPDRHGDIVEPLGAKFSLPLPLLWQHNSSQPVGHVEFAKASETEIKFRATIAKISEDGELKKRLDLAWQSLKANLVRAVSIGFRSIEHSYMESGGVRFIAWEWLELSLVTIPANSEATIQAVKSIDRQFQAASGRKDLADGRPPPNPSVLGKPPRPASSGFFFAHTKGNAMKKTVKEHIEALEAERAAKSARMAEIMQKSIDEGRSTDAEEQEEFDALKVEVKAADADLVRLRDLEKLNVSKATAVTASVGSTQESASEARGGTVLQVKSNLPKGIAMAQVMKFLGRAKGNLMQAHHIAASENGIDPRVVGVLKAAVVAGSTTSGNWANPLVGTESSVYADFVEFLRPGTILGKFGQGNVPSLRPVPFRVALVSQTGGGTGYWVGEGKPKPLTSFAFTRSHLEPTKVANIAVVTEELLRSSSPSADMLIRDQLAAALQSRLDVDFIDPAKAAVAGSSPASITNGIAGTASAGTTAADVRADVRAVVGAFIAANNPLSTGVWIMSASLALSLSMMVNALGQPEFPGMAINGGSLNGMPVITSEYTPVGIVALVNAGDIYLADDGNFSIDVSREASLEMDNAPTQSSVPAVGAAMVSMFQTNSVAFRAEREINWARRRPTGAVAVLTGVAWAP